MSAGTVVEPAAAAGRRTRMSFYQKVEHVTTALRGAEKLGCLPGSIQAKDIVDGRFGIEANIILSVVMCHYLLSFYFCSTSEW